MKKTFVKLLPPALLVILAVVYLFSQGMTPISSRNQTLRLPGAKQYIEAGTYPSLQDAINALSEEGGVVRIPPGVFEIYEPLIINKPDVQIEGAGCATHIKNMNREGKPAMLLQHLDKGEGPELELWRISLLNFRITGNERFNSAYHMLIDRYSYDDHQLHAKVLWPPEWRNVGDDYHAARSLYMLMRYEKDRSLIIKYRMNLNRHWYDWQNQ